jgi:membrane protein
MSGLPSRRAHWRWFLYAVLVRARRIAGLSAQAAKKGLVSLYNSDDLTHAASIAYYSLLSLFPFLLMLISVLGVVTSRSDARAETLNFVLHYFPTRLDFVARQLEALQRTRVPLGLFGGFALIWASLGFFSAISTAVNYAWKVERNRSYLKHKLVAFLMMVTACGLLVLTVFVFSMSQVVGASWFGAVAASYPSLLRLRGLTVSSTATLSLVFGVGLIFYFVPTAKVRFRDVWVGATLTGLLWRVAFAGFAWWVRDMSRYSIHGSIGAVVVFLVWIYISSVILLYGVEFTAAYSRLLRGRDEAAPATPPLGS